MNLEQRLAELEMRLTFQDDLLESLNNALADQQLTIERMQRQLHLLAQRQAELKPVFELADNEPPPPHY